MKTAIVIPARYGSSRLQGKPLRMIAGISLLERVWRIAKKVKGATRIIIATEDWRIVEHARTFGAEAVLTPEDCANGTERVHAAIDAARLDQEILLNLQGDALLTPPWVLDGMIVEMAKAPEADIVTPAVKLEGAALDEFVAHKKKSPASGATVVFDNNRDALYFSKGIVPFMRNPGFTSVYRHIGLYGYRRAALQKYITLPPSPLEQTEGLEQLRALENGMKIRIAIVDYKGRTHGSVDAPEDIALVEQIIAREGELA